MNKFYRFFWFLITIVLIVFSSLKGREDIGIAGYLLALASFTYQFSRIGGAK